MTLGLVDLPCELKLLVLTYLDSRTITQLMAVNKDFRKLCLDTNTWRLRAFEDSSFLSNALRRASVAPYATPRAQLLTNWDYTDPQEPVSWYREYVERYGPVQINWFQQPQISESGISDTIESRGLALYTPGKFGRDSPSDDLLAVSPLDDGTVCIWDVAGRGQRKRGSIMAISKTPVLHTYPGGNFASRSQRIDSSITESVAIDHASNRAFFAVQSRLVEVDLSRLEPISYQTFEWSIMTLSKCSPGLPLTVGTSLGIFLHDFRDNRRRHLISPDVSDRVDNFNVFSGLFSHNPLPPYASLSQPTPLSILHLPTYDDSTVSHDIYVAGRFPSILHYDRRTFPSIVDSIHSGASLSCLAWTPHVFSTSNHGPSRRQGLLPIDVISETLPANGRTLIAGGEYNTKGSLELYSLSRNPDHPGRCARPTPENSFVNRQTSAPSKIMSIATHGGRIVVSDASGFIRWLERDGFTEVRRHHIGPSECLDTSPGSLYAGMPATGEMARKILSTQSVSRWHQIDSNEERPENVIDTCDDGLVFWTGDKLGMLRFARKPVVWSEGFEAAADVSPEERDERAYRQRMREVFDTDNMLRNLTSSTGL
ncbi:F-box domain-containing protein [Ceratocystis lukuohia]|uniref:F-box domain-containing protein n=1 Tax=Ceratocystis lukuohia TaxID=2019550 RepID=A0ABR4MC55_9PEZI